LTWKKKLDDGYHPTVEETAEIEELEIAIANATKLEFLN